MPETTDNTITVTPAKVAGALALNFLFVVAACYVAIRLAQGAE